MAETRPYRVLKGKHGRWVDGKPVTYRPGDTMYLTEAQARRMTSATGSMVEPLWAADEPASAPKPSPKATSLGLADLHWAQAAKVVSELETVEAVEAAREEERAGKARNGVQDAVDARLAELEG